MDFSAGGSGSGSGGGGGGGGGGDGGPGDGRAQAERWLEIAEKLLAARDLVGCKRFAERAVEADPLLPGADELLAVADVLLASQSMGASGHPDPLAILQLPPGASPDHAAVSRAFRRLALLLGQRNPHPGAEMALRLVNDAYAILSDPSRRAPPSANPATGTPSSYQYAAAAAAAPAPDPLEFWTACPFCCYVHQYPRDLIGRALRCPNEGCRRGFVASEIPTPPTVVPGTEMYHCAWGFFPLGLPNAADLGTNWKPFYKVFPWNTAPSGQGGGGGRGSRGGRQPQNDSARGGSSRGRIKKTTARKKVGAGPRRRLGGGVESGIDSEMLGQEGWAGDEDGGDGRAEEVRGININEAAQATDGAARVNVSGAGGVEDMGNFHIDVDTTEDILGNLHNLPFLRVDNLGRMI